MKLKNIDINAGSVNDKRITVILVLGKAVLRRLRMGAIAAPVITVSNEIDRIEAFLLSKCVPCNDV